MPFSSMFLKDFSLNEAIFLSSLQSGIEEGTNNLRELGKKTCNKPAGIKM